jgi:hypothetical protein
MPVQQANSQSTWGKSRKCSDILSGKVKEHPLSDLEHDEQDDRDSSTTAFPALAGSASSKQRSDLAVQRQPDYSAQRHSQFQQHIQ